MERGAEKNSNVKLTHCTVHVQCMFVCFVHSPNRPLDTNEVKMGMMMMMMMMMMMP